LFGVSVLGAFVLVTRALSNGQISLGWAGSEALWFLVVFLVVIPIHELGHALAGALVGLRIRSVIVGVGAPLLSFNVAGVAVRINLLPFGGLTLGTPQGSAWLRLRLWVFALGGPAANVVLCYVLHRLYGQAGAATEQHRLASVASSASWAVLVLNLIPFKTAEGAASDGYSLFTIPFWKSRQLEEARVVVQAMPLMEAMRLDDLAAAGPLADALEADFPEHSLTASLTGSLRHRQGRHAEALTLWRRALAGATLPRQIAFLKNNIAFVDIVFGDPGNFAEADAYSAAAMAVHPELAAFVGTRGAVLVRLGRAAEALPLLRRAVAGGPAPRSQAYNRASLASALAMLGRTADARHELDEARRMNPACELLEPAEADLRLAPAGPLELPPPVGGLPAIAWERWGGLVRWRQIARLLAFLYTLAPLEGASPGAETLILAVVVMLNPELAGLLAFGTCNLWIAATDPSNATVRILTAAAGLIALALAAVRPRLGPSAPSKVPLVLAWILGVLAVSLTAAAPLGIAFGLLRRAIRTHRHAVPSALTLSLHSFRPPPFAAVALVGWATVLLLSRRRRTRIFAIVPLGLALFSLSGNRGGPFSEPHFDNVPFDGAAVTWGAPRPATVLRAARFPTSKIDADPVLSPGGRAFFTRFVEGASPKKSRFGIRVRDFEGHVVDLPGFSATFVDDERVLLLAYTAGTDPAIELSEVRPFSSPTPLWSRQISELGDASVEVEPDGQTIALTGSAPRSWKGVVVRTGFGRDAPLRVEVIPSRHLDADRDVGFFLPPDGEAGNVVSRQRAAPAAANGEGAPFVVNDHRDEERDDLELWALRPAGETLLAAHLPHFGCLEPSVGHPVLWCPAGWGDNRALLKIDAVAGRVTRVGGALPKWGSAAFIARSRLAVVSYGRSGVADRLGVVDLETRRGTWLTLPVGTEPAVGSADEGASRSRAGPVRGGLATITSAGEGEDATLTVYAQP
jgi:tetratricopeptide (TPR) repeat protein